VWYIVIKVFLIVHTTLGPYDTQDECIKQSKEYYDLAKERYDAGERFYYLGLEVKPKNVRMKCQKQ
jgi:hypothetical protein